MNQVVITIARQYGSGGRTVGKMLAERLGISFYDKQIIQMASDESGIDVRLFGKVEEGDKVKGSLFGKEICISREVRNSFQTKIFSTIRQKWSMILQKKNPM